MDWTFELENGGHEKAAMGERQAVSEGELGTREDGVREPASFGQFLRRARSIGFSDAELDRLRATYGHEALEIADEHRSGRKGD